VTVKPVIPRELASRDVAQAIDHDLGEGADTAALRFIEGPLKRPTRTSAEILPLAHRAARTS